ncbi:MAG: NAD(P)H-dependent oxidoreductase [Xanthomonadales bacterium]|nr:NAD(P)H-dependent oxidoreductase [Xanthomonadales bacterium]
MTKNIFVFSGHPKVDSLSGAIADAYQRGAIDAGAQVRRMDLGDMNFEMSFESYGDMPAAEPDILAWQDAVNWSDHLMLVHPCWWGTMPAKTKALFDRALTPGFAYKYHARGVAWDKLLLGKTADAIITADTPPIIDTLLYRRAARRILKNQILGFCGIKTHNAVQFGSVKLADEEKIQRWLAQAHKLGAKAARRKIVKVEPVPQEVAV